jgi:hypothetical protein
MFKRFTTHTLMALAEASLVALLVVGLIAGTAFAGRNTGSSIDLVMVDDMNGDGAPNYAETITFDLSTSAAKPYVNVRCYQGTAFVFDGWAAYYSGAWFGQTFTLASSSWSAGAADCVARLVVWSKNGREKTLATKDVVVGA